jgi:hypothetical protein
VPVDGILDDVRLAAGEPFVKRLVGIIKNLVPFAVPLQFFGLLRPESLPVLDRLLVKLVIVLDMGGL